MPTHHTSISEANEALASAKATQQRTKQREHMLAAALTRKGVVALAAGTYGAMDMMGVSKTIKGFPWKIGIWFLSTLTEAVSKGLIQQSAGGVSDTTLALYLHGAIAGKTVIAGEGGEV